MLHVGEIVGNVVGDVACVIHIAAKFIAPDWVLAVWEHLPSKCWEQEGIVVEIVVPMEAMAVIVTMATSMMGVVTMVTTVV